ncbi:MAX dimerization protein 4 MXD4 mRNA [Crotalus adamanteus]|uniref:MAX dimerization protein 4 MXD4 mRNA n=1 Tax=Crotalus adamanteus TaxID=8729 RepID=A0AAW1BHT3_CROAD
MGTPLPPSPAGPSRAPPARLAAPRAAPASLAPLSPGGLLARAGGRRGPGCPGDVAAAPGGREPRGGRWKMAAASPAHSPAAGGLPGGGPPPGAGPLEGGQRGGVAVLGLCGKKAPRQGRPGPPQPSPARTPPPPAPEPPAHPARAAPGTRRPPAASAASSTPSPPARAPLGRAASRPGWQVARSTGSRARQSPEAEPPRRQSRPGRGRLARPRRRTAWTAPAVAGAHRPAAIATTPKPKLSNSTWWPGPALADWLGSRMQSGARRGIGRQGVYANEAGDADVTKPGGNGQRGALPSGERGGGFASPEPAAAPPKPRPAPRTVIRAASPGAAIPP